ncbi:hypothetical protein, partial [Enterobacter hormaechei]
GLHTVFPLKMPGGGVVFRRAFSLWAGHPTAARPFFFINTRHKLIIKKPAPVHPQGAPPGLVNVGVNKPPLY